MVKVTDLCPTGSLSATRAELAEHRQQLAVFTRRFSFREQEHEGELLSD